MGSRIHTSRVTRVTVVLISFLAVLVWSEVATALQFLIDFDDLSEGYEFSPSSQPYDPLDGEGRGITIGGGYGTPTVIRPEGGAHSAPHALSNARGTEFGSENQDLEITLNGFTSDHVRVFVGLPERAICRVTAHMWAFSSSGHLVGGGHDEVHLGYGPLLLNHELSIEVEGGTIARVVIAYGYDDDPDPSCAGDEHQAFDSELIDSLLISVYEGPVTPPPIDEIPPVVHITSPDDGDTVESGIVMGYVEEDGILEDGDITVSADTGDRMDARIWRDRYVDGIHEFHFVADELNLVSGLNRITVTAVDAGSNSDSETVEVTYAAHAYPPPPPTWPATLDIVSAGMEVTQAIQGWDTIDPSLRPGIDNASPLVAGKKTLARVYATVSGVDMDVPNVGCTLRAYSGHSSGEELPGSPIPAMNRVTLVPGETHLDHRQDPAKSFNFILPPEWTEAGAVRLVATVNPFAGVPEAHYDAANNAVKDITFRSTEQVCVYVYPIRSTDEGDVAPSWRDCLDNIGLMQKMYPASPDRFRVSLAHRISTNAVLMSGSDDDRKDELHDLLTAFRRYLGFYYGQSYIYSCSNPVWLGLTHETVTHRGVTNSTFPVSLSVASDDYFYRMKTGHEVGHAMGLGHVQGCDDPADPYESYPLYHDPSGGHYPEASIGDWGVLIEDDNSLVMEDPALMGDMMSYCGSNRWMSVHTWDRLFDRFALPSSRIASLKALADPVIAKTAPYLYVSGSVKLDEGRVELDPAWRRNLAAGSSDHAGTGAYTIELLDAKEAVLFARSFDPVPLANLENYAEFFEIIPAQAGTRTLRVSGPGIKIPVAITAGTSAPGVIVTIPKGGETWDATGTEHITWNASDPDGDPLTYTAFYSHDNGETWQVVAAGLKGSKGTSVVLDDLPGCKASCLVRVAASDGINQGTATSGPFTKEGQPPLVAIASPAGGAVFTQGERIVFEGVVSDREHGTLADSDIVWISDVDGTLGTGAVVGTTNLSRGFHLVELAATDPDGMKSSDVVGVYIVPPVVAPDVKANDSDNAVTLSQTDTLSVTASLNAGTGMGLSADWWVVAAASFGIYSFDAVNLRWVPGLAPAYKGPLFDLRSVEFFRLAGLPPGSYAFFFGVDMNMNGNLDGNVLTYDQVLIHVR